MIIKIIGFTGTRWGMTKYQMEEVRRLLRETGGKEFHHGDCMGADEQSHRIAQVYGYNIIIHPPIKTILRAFCRGGTVREAKEYITRNIDIIKDCDLLIACPVSPDETSKSGTWNTIRRAKKLQSLYMKPYDIIIVLPYGE